MSYREAPPSHPVVTVQGAYVRGFDPLTGRMLWHQEVPARVVRFALAHGRVYVLDLFCALTCIDAQTGLVIGGVQIATRETTACALVAGPELVYVLTSNSLAAIDMNGRFAWQVPNEGARTWMGGLGVPGQVVQPDPAPQ
jgi:hypothetical protein